MNCGYTKLIVATSLKADQNGATTTLKLFKTGTLKLTSHFANLLETSKTEPKHLKLGNFFLL